MKKVQVNAENGSYDILIGSGLLTEEYMKDYTDYVIVTDDEVYPLYGKYFPDAKWIVLPAGEAAKSMQNLEMIYEKLMEYGIDRKGALVALGGGVVGDITGFAAATFKRGIAFIQIPTTLLAQVDSSVGGKVAVNLPSGKNMVGAFYQPAVVAADTDTLKTLDKRQYAAGMAEVIKYSYIFDEELHQVLLEGAAPVEEIIARCCEIKADYVRRDPYDLKDRLQLNYGHTMGHAIETAAGYGTFLHGEAVALGMMIAAQLGEALGISPSGLAEDTRSMLQKYGLPVSVDKKIIEDALKILLADKKAEGTRIWFILIDRIGHAVIKSLEVATIRKTVKELYL